MKVIILFFVLILSANAAEFLTASQKAHTLTAIDNICGDTWCEGEFDFSFDKINCDDQSKTCTVWMRLYDGYEEREAGEATFSGSCTIDKLSKKEDIYKGEHLVIRFYEDLTDCITDLEEQAREYI